MASRTCKPYGTVRITFKPEPAPTVKRIAPRSAEVDDFDWDKVANDWNWKLAELKVRAEAEAEETAHAAE